MDVDFHGILIADHVPRMVGNNRTRRAYRIRYINEMYDMAQRAPSQLTTFGKQIRSVTVQYRGPFSNAV